MSDLLPMFCIAAGHETCSRWEEHRLKLNLIDAAIHVMIESIPDAIAVGKATQKAGELGQDTLIGEAPKRLFKHQSYRDVVLPPKKVHWYSTTDYPDRYRPDGFQDGLYLSFPVDKQGARGYTIEHYKPRQVEIFFDGEPDEWNGKR